MAKVRGKDTIAYKHPAKRHLHELLTLVADRIHLPDVPMIVDYHDDVDTLVIHFKTAVSPNLINYEDEAERGVIGIYEDKRLVGVEILDITGQLEHVNPK